MTANYKVWLELEDQNITLDTFGRLHMQIEEVIEYLGDKAIGILLTEIQYFKFKQYMQTHFAPAIPSSSTEQTIYGFPIKIIRELEA